MYRYLRISPLFPLPSLPRTHRVQEILLKRVFLIMMMCHFLVWRSRSIGPDIFRKLIPLLPYVFPSFLTSVNVSEQNWSRCQLLYFLWNINSSLTELSWWYCNENRWILWYNNLRFCKQDTVQKKPPDLGLCLEMCQYTARNNSGFPDCSFPAYFCGSKHVLHVIHVLLCVMTKFVQG